MSTLAMLAAAKRIFPAVRVDASARVRNQNTATFSRADLRANESLAKGTRS